MQTNRTASGVPRRVGRVTGEALAAAVTLVMAAIYAIASLVGTWLRRWSRRSAIKETERWVLDDMGIDADVAFCEARKPFWRA